MLRAGDEANRAEGLMEGEGGPQYWKWAALMHRAFDIDVLDGTQD